MQHLPPNVSSPFSRRIDTALLAAAERATAINFAGDDITTRRAAFPPSLRGIGLRNHQLTANAAFLGTLNQAVSRFVDYTDKEGEVFKGFFPSLAPLVGAGSFDFRSPPGVRFGDFIANESVIALALRDAWDAMRGEIGAVDDQHDAAIFANSADGANGTQRELTRAVELKRFTALGNTIQALPFGDQRGLAWASVDGASNVWVTSCPTGGNRAGPAAFREIACRYMGAKSPCACALEGQTIWSDSGARGTCDAFGNELTSRHLAGDGWRTAHDTIKHAIGATLSSLRLPYTCEVFGLLSSCIPHGPRHDALLALQQNRRLGLVPDFRIGDLNGELGNDGGPAVAGTQRLAELKRINLCHSRYPPRAVCRGHLVAVNNRAAKIQPEYVKKARDLDEKYGTTPVGQPGPCFQRMRAYGPVLALVVGHFGEWSPDLHRLVNAMAAVAVPRVGGLYNSRSAEQAKAAIVWKARRDIAWAGLNANATLLLDRAEWVGPSRAAAGRSQQSSRARVAQQIQAARDAVTGRRAAQRVRQGYQQAARGDNPDCAWC